MRILHLSDALHPPVTGGTEVFIDRLLAAHGCQPSAALERFAFYERAARAFAIVATGETRIYGNILLKKGVVRP